MPFYEYKCRECSKEFEIFSRSLSQESEERCPECGSEEVEKKLSRFASGVSSAGASEQAPPPCSGDCCSCGL